MATPCFVSEEEATGRTKEFYEELKGSLGPAIKEWLAWATVAINNAKLGVDTHERAAAARQAGEGASPAAEPGPGPGRTDTGGRHTARPFAVPAGATVPAAPGSVARTCGPARPAPDCAARPPPRRRRVPRSPGWLPTVGRMPLSIRCTRALLRPPRLSVGQRPGSGGNRRKSPGARLAWYRHRRAEVAGETSPRGLTRS